MKDKKSRILYLYKYLNEDADENNPVSTIDIINHLNGLDISAHRETVAEDIALLQEFGIDVIKVRTSCNRYFIGMRDFELAELKLLVDAVQSSKFITEKKSNELIKKISSLTANNNAELLKKHTYSFENIKPINEQVYYIADTIHTAIIEQKMIEFRYYEYTPTKQRSFKHNEYRYKLSPYTLFWSEDHYYVIGYSEKHDKIAHFRVDRMEQPVLLEDYEYIESMEYSPSEYAEKVFDMYDGEIKYVELKCEHSLMDVIVDKFGQDVDTRILDYDFFIASVEVSVSPTFYAWIFQFGGRVRIVSPTDVVVEMKNMASKFI
jgi:predicted DNA-binding transcriptional regulator YafY